jgi:hypothetical protein
VSYLWHSLWTRIRTRDCESQLCAVDSDYESQHSPGSDLQASPSHSIGLDFVMESSPDRIHAHRWLAAMSGRAMLGRYLLCTPVWGGERVGFRMLTGVSIMK